ncbi:MAG: DUF523 and DUF1722 domain-containing protein [Actinobacteria bacterium]|nr:DUF523 and DUF1722 domain-containing protein [Acidimicrobiia bacterium]MBM4437964.1 DUF523 and DUF1722 domain-containing protein [Actinomycetota bacterium]
MAKQGTAAAEDRIGIGISSCLLGEEVRFDGGHKRDRFLTDTLGPLVEWVPVCPEVEAGFGTPREAMRLVGEDGRLRLVTVRTAVDLTDRLDRYAARRVGELAHEGLSGYVLKKDSPSCGMERVKVYGTAGVPARSGRGLFAAALLDRFPFLPVEEEGRLSDPVLRDNFIERVFAYRRLQRLFAGRWTVGQLVRFHTAHKLTLMAHAEKTYRSLGPLVSRAKALPRASVKDQYTEGFMTALAAIATRRRHTNVLQHVAGYFKTTLDSADRRELHGAIDDYRRGLVPLVVPITLIRHYVRRHDVAYLEGQTYLEPHPKELMLRNHV